MKLIVGLGNPGKQYDATRHNVGFMVLDLLAEHYGLKLKSERSFEYALFETSRSEEAALVKPSTFMNLSGHSVLELLEYFKNSSLKETLVVLDDVNLPLGKIRLRAHGSSGGHHGLESIEQVVGSKEFPRLRVGVSQENLTGKDLSGYVLGKFKKSETKLLEETVGRAAQASVCWLEEGVAVAMNEFNR